MFSDEGIGVHLSRLLKRKYRFSSAEHTIEIVDGGTLAQLLTPIIAQFDYCLIFDCISADDADFGDVFFFDYEDMPRGVHWQGSAHEVEMLQTLAMMDMLGDRPRTKIIGIVPQVVGDTTLTMTESAKKGALVMEQTAIAHIKDLGVAVETIEPELTIQQVANEFGRRE
jgi:hydrogenase maturation protease